MPMQKAIWKVCPGVVNDGLYAHSMRDHCTSCAPFWEKYPICQHCEKKLRKGGKTKCKNCAKFVMVWNDPGLTKAEIAQYTDETRYPVYRPKGG